MVEIYIDEVITGPLVKPITIIYSYSDKEWEAFIEEWVDIKKRNYVEVEQIGGAGDMGRDVIAYINKDKPSYQWDCYQCKHYKNPIAPNNIYVEFGKIIYYTFKKEYPLPNKYFIAAPKGVGRKLSDLLNKPTKLKEDVRTTWDKYCKTNITKTTTIDLKGDFLDYFEKFDFSIFERILPKTIIEEFKQKSSANYIKRFGGGLPTRDKLTGNDIPYTTQQYEIKYTNQLIKAYNTDKLSNSFSNENDLINQKPYIDHFRRAREGFHNAEQLRNFSRDTLGEHIFESFQQEIYDRVVDLTEEEQINKFHVAKNVERQAMDLPIESNPLKTRCNVTDKKGICHQLVNDSKLYWVKDDEE